MIADANPYGQSRTIAFALDWFGACFLYRYGVRARYRRPATEEFRLSGGLESRLNKAVEVDFEVGVSAAVPGGAAAVGVQRRGSALQLGPAADFGLAVDHFARLLPDACDDPAVGSVAAPGE